MPAITLPDNVFVVGVGHKRGSGKDTFVIEAADCVRAKGGIALHFSFAGPLKEVVGKLFRFSQTQMHTPEDKATTDSRWGVTPRKVLQVAGTECFRDIFHSDFWIMVAQVAIQEAIDEADGQQVIIFFSDTRFRNEANFIKKMDGEVVHIVRPCVLEAEKQARESGIAIHVSETDLDGYEGWNRVVMNDGTRDEFLSAAARYVDYIYESKFSDKNEPASDE